MWPDPCCARCNPFILGARLVYLLVRAFVRRWVWLGDRADTIVRFRAALAEWPSTPWVARIAATLAILWLVSSWILKVAGGTGVASATGG